MATSGSLTFGSFIIKFVVALYLWEVMDSCSDFESLLSQQTLRSSVTTSKRSSLTKDTDIEEEDDLGEGVRNGSLFQTIYCRHLCDDIESKAINEPFTAECRCIYVNFLDDPRQHVREAAFVEIARFAKRSPLCALQLFQCHVLEKMNQHFFHNSPGVKAACMYVIRALCSHSSAITQKVIEKGGLDVALRYCDEMHDKVLQSSVRALGHIARWREETVIFLRNKGIVKRIINHTFSEENPKLKLYSFLSLMHMKEVCGRLLTVFNDMAVKRATDCLQFPDKVTKMLTLGVLEKLSELDMGRSELVIGQSIKEFKKMMKEDGIKMRVGVAKLLLTILRNAPETWQIILLYNLQEELYQLVETRNPECVAPALKVLCHLVSKSPTYSLNLLRSLDRIGLERFLRRRYGSDMWVIVACMWKQLGMHSPVHAQIILNEPVTKHMVKICCRETTETLVRGICKDAMDAVIKMCIDVRTLGNLLITEEPNIVKGIVNQLDMVVPQDIEGRKDFILDGRVSSLEALKSIPEVAAQVEHLLGYFTPEMIRSYNLNLEVCEEKYPELLASTSVTADSSSTLSISRESSSSEMDSDFSIQYSPSFSGSTSNRISLGDASIVTVCSRLQVSN